MAWKRAAFKCLPINNDVSNTIQKSKNNVLRSFIALIQGFPQRTDVLH